jgi:hypothetical protein
MKRKENESFADYKIRRTKQNAIDKANLKGSMVWDSTNGKTYNLAKHGELV